MPLLDELKRRNVIRVAIAYLASAWLLIQVGETLFAIYQWPESALRLMTTLLVLGFVPALVISWVFELTPQGLVRDTESAAAPTASHKQFDRYIILVMALALSYFSIDKWVLDPVRDEALATAAARQGRDKALGDLTQHVEGLGPALGLDQVEA